MSEDAPRELGWQAGGLHIAGLGWGQPGARPVLALHGWLDNAASFSQLGPRLIGCECVALDLTGHGRSAHRSTDATYQIWDDLPQIASVIDQLGWQEFDLLGHSRGAVIACLLGAAMPERVKRLVLLDGIGPYPAGEESADQRLRKFIDDRQRLLARELKVYDTEQEAITVRQAQDKMPPEAAALISRRNLRAGPAGFGYSWSTDPRLRGTSAVKFSQAQVEEIWRSLSMPGLLLLADPGQNYAGMREWATGVAESMPDMRVETFAGGHHFHMEAAAAEIAGRIVEFLQESVP
ncbi:MAG: alpha/beta fold hydrolase [Pseudomonadota bacterium]